MTPPKPLPRGDLSRFVETGDGLIIRRLDGSRYSITGGKWVPIDENDNPIGDPIDPPDAEDEDEDDAT